MEYIIVVGAGLLGYVFGAVWYSALGKMWQTAVGLSDEDVKPANSKGAYISALFANIIIAGMMRHIFAASGVFGFGLGAISGLGLGLFIAGSYLALNYSFAKRPMSLRLIDIGHAAGSATVMGAFLGVML